MSACCKTGELRGHESINVNALVSLGRMTYPINVPEKEGTRGGSLKTVERTSRASGIVLCACLRASQWSGGGVGAYVLAGFALLYQSSNPPFAAPPVWKRGCGVHPNSKEGTHA